MGCEGSQVEGSVALPRKKPTVSQEAVRLIGEGQYESVEAIADGYFGEGRITEAIQVYQKIIEAHYVHEYEIQGVGCSELALSRYEWFIHKWYS
jgi:pentatricopeptide repeat protein